jgi:hypothetical protein
MSLSYVTPLQALSARAPVSFALLVNLRPRLLLRQDKQQVASHSSKRTVNRELNRVVVRPAFLLLTVAAVARELPLFQPAFGEDEGQTREELIRLSECRQQC